MAQPRWFLSQFVTDKSAGIETPVCASYGGTWLCPQIPEAPDTWALVLMLASVHQVEAASKDPRVKVCPFNFDPSPVPDLVVAAHAKHGAKSGMSMGALLAQLASVEPMYAHSSP